MIMRFPGSSRCQARGTERPADGMTIATNDDAAHHAAAIGRRATARPRKPRRGSLEAGVDLSGEDGGRATLPGPHPVL
jgi:hypothetical protein